MKITHAILTRPSGAEKGEITITQGKRKVTFTVLFSGDTMSLDAFSSNLDLSLDSHRGMVFVDLTELEEAQEQIT